MSELRKFCYSEVTLLLNQSDADGLQFPLGFVIGFTTEHYNVVGLAMRATVESSFLDRLDSLSRDIVINRSTILEAEILEATTIHSNPKDVLALLAERNPWSFNVSLPRDIEFDAESQRGSSIEKIAEDYILKVFQQRVRGDLPLFQNIRATTHSYGGRLDQVGGRLDHLLLSDENAQSAEISAFPSLGWMQAPKVWQLPKISEIAG